MRDSWFPRSAPPAGATGHRLTDEGVFEPEPTRVSTVPAAAGLWTTAADLVRFGLGWSTLLPDALAREALHPRTDRDDLGGQAGLGWMLMLPKDVAGHPGAGPGFSASLIIRPSTGRPWVVFTNRRVLVEAVNERLALPIA
jgi:CubicO group peptidase (beta-lactamase class C family)